MYYIWWVPSVISMYVLYAWIAYKNNTQQELKWFILLSCMGAIPLWSIVSKSSKNLVIDGIIYNFLLITSETLALIYFTEMKPTLLQTFGIIFALLGIFLINC